MIGNSAYQHAGELANTRNDALDMAAALRMHGFQVLDGIDLDKAALERKIRDFSAALVGADVGVFFYAGHGMQISGTNYLVPIDAQLRSTSTRASRPALRISACAGPEWASSLYFCCFFSGTWEADDGIHAPIYTRNR